MVEYVGVAEARAMSGLRLVLTAGVPGPWGEAAKGLFRVKGLPFVAVRQEAGAEDPVLREWTGQTSAPVAVWNDERPRCTSLEILMLAERLGPAPALLPAEPEERALAIGLCHEIVGEDGLGWNRRLLLFREAFAGADDDSAARAVPPIAVKYGYGASAAAAAPARVAQILTLLAERLERQHAAGSRFLVGDRLSALDVYWAAFATMLDPLPPEQCPMPDFLRTMYTVRDPVVRAALNPLLLAHRDFVYRDFIGLPLDF
jgi:glutathione S-transferase